MCAYWGWVQGGQSSSLSSGTRSGGGAAAGFPAAVPFHYQRFQLKTLYTIVEGVTTRLAGCQEMLAPNLGYRSGAYQAPTWVPFQVLRAAQDLPSQDADVLVSGPDGPSDVDPCEFLHADISDCDDVPELSVGSLGDVVASLCSGSGLVRVGEAT